jgi:hypothetical protein
VEARRFYREAGRIRLRRAVLPGWFATVAILLPIVALFARGSYRWYIFAASFAPAVAAAVVWFGNFGSAWLEMSAREVRVRAKTGKTRRIRFAAVESIIVGEGGRGERRGVWAALEGGERVFLGERKWFALSLCRALAAHVGCRLRPEGRMAGREVRRVVRRFLRCNGRHLSYVLFVNREWYRTYQRGKRCGGTREIAEPMPVLKGIQRQFLARILSRMEPGPHAHGFVRGRSIVTNAAMHVGKDVVLHLDLKDYFPTVTARRVYGLLVSEYFYPQEAALLTKLATWQGRLPQGAPTSPALANLVSRRLDRRLAGLARCFGADYSRYADDLVLSGPDGVRKMIPLVRRIVEEEGFRLAEHKIGVFRPHRQQRVTGLVVNRRVSVPRRTRRWVRAVVHNCARNGISRENRERDPLFAERIRGYVELVRMVHPEEGAALLAQWEAAPA